MSLPKGCELACRGCFHRDIALDASLKQKSDWLKKTLAPWADCITDIAHLAWEQQLGYREKVCLPARWDGTTWQFGLRSKKEIVFIPDCPAHSERIRQTYRILQKYLPGPDTFPLAYYVQSGAQLVMVVKANSVVGVRWTEPFFRELLAAGNEGIWLHLHACEGDKVFAKFDWQFLYGKQLSMNPLKLIYGPASYQQMIPSLYMEAIGDTLDFFEIRPGDGVVDLYSGVGSTMVAWTRAGAQGIGVEICAEAVECARMNLSGTVVLRGKCHERLPQLNEWLGYRGVGRRLLYTNPPRVGMEKPLIDWINQEYKPERIAYLSCNAETLRRDLEAFTNNGYRVVRMRPFDFFPRTHLIECLAFLERQ